ncbi:MAG: hypothetical protein WCJ21_00415 [Planctomycetota bacterium]
MMKNKTHAFSRWGMRGVLFVAGTAVMLALPASALAEKPVPAHVHAAEGPHHGSLIELGRGDYHAELVHDSATHTITIYLLDSAAKNAVTIPAQQLSLNLLVSGKPQQYQLMAQPQPTDPEGMCSAFTSASEPMCKAMDAKGTTGRLNVPIEGKVFAGRIDTHSHPHPH